MFKARYYKTDGKKGRAQALPDSIFDGIVHESAMHQVVRAFLANQRQGTASAKSRSDVRGGSRKPWRQKGTGRARQGTIRAAQWEGDQVTVWHSTQSIFGTRSSVAEALDIPQDQVRAICDYIGGGFGSKWGAEHFTLLAVLASREMVAALWAVGSRRIRYTEYKRGGAHSWERAWEDPVLITWLFSHSRMRR